MVEAPGRPTNNEDEMNPDCEVPMTVRFRSDRFAPLLLSCAAAVVLFALPCRADAPPGHFTDNKDGTVRDNKTGLLWQQGIDPNQETWAAAGTYCQGLGLAGGGWRLPSDKELITLSDVRRHDPSIDPTLFPNTPSVEFWTSSQLAGDPQVAWVVDFDYGYTGNGGGGDTFRARCVR